MKGLKRNKKRVLGFALALVMVVSVIAGGNMFEVKAEASNTYAPYYDTTDGKVYGCPEVGTHILPNTVFSGEKLDEGMNIWIYSYDSKEEAEQGEWWSATSISYGETRTPEIGGVNFDPAYGWIVSKCYYDEETYYAGTDNEVTYKNIVIEGYAKVPPTEINPINISVNWENFLSFEIGKPLPDIDENLMTMSGNGIKDFYVVGLENTISGGYLVVKATQNHVNAGYITQDIYSYAVLEDGGWVEAWQYSDDYVVQENDEYGLKMGVYSSPYYRYSTEIFNWGEADITQNINLLTEGVELQRAYTCGLYEAVWECAYVELSLGMGTDIVQAINSSTQEPTTPPTENVDLMEAFTDEILAFYSDFVGVEITNESTNIFEDGEEIHPYATGTAQYIDEARLWWVSCAWIDSQEGVMIEVVDINDTTKSNEIAEKFSEWEYYQSFPQETFQYHNGEYIIFVVIPKIYTEAGLTLDVAKAYLDKAYNEATNQVTEEKNDYDANVVNTTNIANKIELTEAEKAAIDNGVQLDVVLSFQDTGAVATTEEQKIIEKKLEDKTIGTFLEIDLSKKIGAFETKLSETNGMIEITFELPQELKNADTSVNRTYSVMRYHDGIVDVLDAEYDVATGKLSFETDKFSTYAVIYSDEEVDSTSSTSTPSTSTPSTSTPSTSTPSTSTSTTTNTTTNTTTSTPQTGDTANMFVYIALLCFAMYSVVLVLRKQRKF